MKKLIFTILLIVFGGLSLFAQQKEAKEECEIYTRIFEQLHQNFKPNENDASIAILKNTIDPDWTALEKFLNQKRLLAYLYDGEFNELLMEDLLKDFKKMNKKTVDLENSFSIGFRYSLISKSELDALLTEGKKEQEEFSRKCEMCLAAGYEWQPFHRKYRNSGGLHSFSQTGFSKDKKLAFVYVTLESGDTGSSTFYILQKLNNKWKIYKSFGSGWAN